MTAQTKTEVKQKAEDFLMGILKEITAEPESIMINGEIDAMGLNLVITLSEKDIASVIGEKGENVQQLRRFMRLWGYRNQAKINVYIPPTNKEQTL